MTDEAEAGWDELVDELATVPAVGPARIANVREAFETPAELAAADPSDLEGIPQISARTAYRIVEAARRVCTPALHEDENHPDAVRLLARVPADDVGDLSSVRAFPHADSYYVVWANGSVTIGERGRTRFAPIPGADHDPPPPDPGRKRGPHGVVRFLRGCRCPDCVTAWSDAYGAATERLAGVTSAAIADRLGLTRESVRLITEKVAPWRPWRALAAERRAIAEEVAASDPVVAKRCPLCGVEFSGAVSELANRRFCGPEHTEMWTAIRYHADAEQYERQRRSTARWALFHQDRATPSQVREARRILDYPDTGSGQRWLIEGSRAFQVAVTALRQGWPVFDRLEPQVQAQVSEWDRENPDRDPSEAVPASRSGGPERRGGQNGAGPVR